MGFSQQSHLKGKLSVYDFKSVIEELFSVKIPNFPQKLGTPGRKKAQGMFY